MLLVREWWHLQLDCQALQIDQSHCVVFFEPFLAIVYEDDVIKDELD